VQRVLAKVDPAILDGYVGAYRLSPTTVQTITRNGNQLYAQLSGQERLEIFPQSDHEFFLKEVDALLTFETGADGKAMQVILHQNGADYAESRLTDSEAKRIAENEPVVAKKFKDQTQDPRTETALRRLLDQIRRGAPDYDQVSPEIAAVMRKQLPELQSTIKQRGAMQSLAFKGVGRRGSDIYEVKFENGAMEWRVILETDGKIAYMEFR
jgi:hypothetical protein